MGQYRLNPRREMRVTFFLVFIISFIIASEVNVDKPKRDPKLLLVTSTTSTSTLSTAWTCYAAAAAIGATGCGRKKRSILTSPDGVQISPSKPDKDLIEDGRNPKFLNYFMTVTDIYTFTSYIATSTLASLHCTPDGWTMAGCPGSFGK